MLEIIIGQPIISRIIRVHFLRNSFTRHHSNVTVVIDIYRPEQVACPRMSHFIKVLVHPGCGMARTPHKTYYVARWDLTLRVPQRDPFREQLIKGEMTWIVRPARIEVCILSEYHWGERKFYMAPTWYPGG